MCKFLILSLFFTNIICVFRAHYISRKLTAARFIPVESDAEWSDYYLFTKAISKGDSNIVRRGVKKGKGKVSKPKGKFPFFVQI